MNMAALKFVISLLLCAIVLCDDGVPRRNPFIRPVLEYLNGNPNSVYDYISGTVLSAEKKANIIELSAQIDVNCNNRFPEIPCNERAFICHAFLGHIPENPDDYQVMSDVRCTPKIEIVVDEADYVQRPVSPVAFAENGRIDLSNEALQPGQEKADFVAIQRDSFPCLGCPYDLNKNAEGVDELLAAALKHIESEKTQRHKVINIRRLQQQVVAGLKYILQIEVAATTCSKDADVSAPCVLDATIEPFVCEVIFIQKPWISKSKHIIKNNCTSSQEFEPSQTGLEKNDIENDILPHGAIQDPPYVNPNPSEPDFHAMANTGQIEENIDPNRLTDLESQILLDDITPSQIKPYAEPPVEEIVSNQNQFSEPTSYNNRRTLYASMPIVDEIEPIILMYPPQLTPDMPMMMPVDFYHERLARELNKDSSEEVTTHPQESKRVRRAANKDDSSSSSSSSSSSEENNEIEVATKNGKDDSSSSSSDDEEKDRKDVKAKMRKQDKDDCSSSSSSSEDDDHKKRNKRSVDDSSSSSSDVEDKNKNEIKEKVKDDSSSSSSSDDDDKKRNKRTTDDSSSSSTNEENGNIKDKSISSSSDEDKKRTQRSVSQMEPILPEEKFIVRDLADFAVTEHDNEDFDHQKTTILQILGAKKLVLDGRIYYQIIMRLGTSHCHENDYREDCREKLITNLTKICKMQVRVDMDYSNPKVVKSRCQQVKKFEDDRNRTNLKRSRRSPPTTPPPPKTYSKIFDNLTDDAIIQMALQYLTKKSDQTIPTYFEHTKTISSYKMDRIHYSSISAQIRQCQGETFSDILCKESITCQFQFFNNLAYKQNGRILVKCEKAEIDLYVPINFEEALGGDKLEETFRSFGELFEKRYQNETERLYRMTIFKNNLKKIDLLNTHEQGTATYGITEFTDMTEKEFSESRGLKQELRSENDLSFAMAQIPNVEIPVELDWRQKGAVTKVKNQGICGSCWAFSVTGNVEGQYAIKHGKLLEFSEQELVDCDKTDEGCNGGLMDNAYRAIEKLGGLESESDYPYEGDDETCHFNPSKVEVTLTGAVNISHNETDMAKWLSSNGPISIAINANAMQFYFGGVSHPFKFLCNPKNLDHGVLIVGYGIDKFSYLKKQLPYWIVKNSWGTSWGEQGYYRVYRGDGTCGLNQTPSSAIIE